VYQGMDGRCKGSVRRRQHAVLAVRVQRPLASCTLFC
jgi:hypothetical protein